AMRTPSVLIAVMLAQVPSAHVAAQQKQIDVSPSGATRTIAAAVAAATPGARIVVHAGVYDEPTIVVNKRVELVGEGAPVLNGAGTHGLILVTADDVTVRGFVLRNVGTSFVED